MAGVVVKLGSSIVADPQGEVRLDVLGPICDAVAARHAAGDSVVLVTSGAIARGIRLMELGGRPAAMEELQAASAVGQGKLYRAYDELLAERGVPSAQVLLTFFDMSARTHYVNARHTLEKLLDWRVVPVINENDTTTTDDISFGDNDFLAAQVAILLGADRLVLLTDTGRPLHRRPVARPLRASRSRRSSSFEQLEGLDIGFSASPLGSGGMRSKVVAAEMATAAGIPAVIASGVAPASVAAALDGEPAGTLFHPQEGAGLVVQAVAEVREAHAGHAHRRRRGRAGAARARHEPAAGGDRGGRRAASTRATRWRCAPPAATPRPIGKGIVNYSAEELARIRGMKSDAVLEVFPRAAEEAPCTRRIYFSALS